MSGFQCTCRPDGHTCPTPDECDVNAVPLPDPFPDLFPAPSPAACSDCGHAFDRHGEDEQAGPDCVGVGFDGDCPCEGYVAPSPAAEPPDGLREALGKWLYLNTSPPQRYPGDARHWLAGEVLEAADGLLAGPLAPLLDRAAKAEAAVARVEALADELTRDAWNICGTEAARAKTNAGDRIRRAIRFAS